MKKIPAPGLDDLAEDLNLVIDDLSGRDDLLLSLQFDAPSDPPGTFTSRPYPHITVNAAATLDDASPAEVDVLTPAGRRRHAVLMGTMCHEAGHARIAGEASAPAPVSPSARRLAVALTEPLVEHLHLRDRPADQIYLRAAAGRFLRGAIGPSATARLTDSATSACRALEIAILVLGRVDAGVLTDAETADLATELTTLLGEETFGRARATWQRMLAEVGDTPDMTAVFTAAQHLHDLITPPRPDTLDDASDKGEPPGDTADGHDRPTDRGDDGPCDAGAGESEETRGPAASPAAGGSPGAGSPSGGSSGMALPSAGPSAGAGAGAGDRAGGSAASRQSGGTGAGGGTPADEPVNDEADRIGDPAETADATAARGDDACSPHGAYSSGRDDSEGTGGESTDGEGTGGESTGGGDTGGGDTGGGDTGGGDSVDGAPPAWWPSCGHPIPDTPGTPGTPGTPDSSRPGHPAEPDAVGKDPLRNALAMAAAATEAISGEAVAESLALADQMDPPPRLRPPADGMEALDRERAAEMAHSVFHAYSPTGQDPRRGSRPPTSDERRAASTLVARLRRARYRAPERIRVSSQLPPGGLHGGQLMLAEAQRTLGLEVTAQPFRRHQTTVTEEPPVTVGIAIDVSGSMSMAVRPMVAASWVIAAAVDRVGGRCATVAFGKDVTPIVTPGTRPRKVAMFSAPDGTEDIVGALTALDGALQLTHRKGARLLVIVSDGMLVGPGQRKTGQRLLTRLTRAGVKTLWLNFTRSCRPLDGGIQVDIPPGADNLQAARIIGAAAASALSRA